MTLRDGSPDRELPIAKEQYTTKEQWLNLGVLHYRSEHYDESIKACEMAIELDRNYALAYYGKGLALLEQGLYTEAIKDFDKAIELQPEDAKSYAGKGKSLYRLEHYEAALAVYEKALELDMCNQRAFVGVWTSLNEIGNKLCQLKKYDEALVAYKKALQLETNSPRIYYNLGNAYYDCKQYIEACEAYEKCMLIDRSFEVLYVNKIKDLFNVGIKLLEMKLYKEASGNFRNTITFCHNRPKVLLTLAENLVDRGKQFYNDQEYANALFANDSALVFFDYAFANRYSDKWLKVVSEIQYLKGETYFQLKRYKDARNAFNEAIQLDHSKAEEVYQNKREDLEKQALALTEIALSKCDLQAYKTAGYAFKDAIRFHSRSYLYDQYKNIGREILAKALEYYNSSQFTESIFTYRSAIQFDPANANFSVVKGKSLDQLKQLNELQQDEDFQYPDIETDEFDEINGEEIIDENMLMPDGYQKGAVIAYAKYTGWDFDNPEEYYLYNHFVMEHVD